jgi:hypothetical protein
MSLNNLFWLRNGERIVGLRLSASLTTRGQKLGECLGALSSLALQRRLESGQAGHNAAVRSVAVTNHCPVLD